MVGVPTSKRCTFCKTRKTKCDEKWPTCGTCSRAGKVCSGARTDFKFVINGSHSEASNSAVAGTSTRRISPVSTSVTQAKRRWPDPGIIIYDPQRGFDDTRDLKRCPAARLSKSPPWNPPDQITAYFITCLESTFGDGYDLRILGAFVPFLPQYIGSGNTALGHAVELFLGAWTNSRRGSPSDTWLDLTMYNRALRSMKAALYDANPDQLTSTLTALCLLQKTEILYDFQRGSNQENHAAGIIAVVNKAGPKQPMTDMVLHVTFEGIFHMLQKDIRQGRDSDFHTPEWMAAFRKSIDMSNIRPHLKHMYHLWVEMTAWPILSRLTRMIRRNPSDTMTAAELHMRATALAEFLRHQDDTIINSLAESGAVTKVENMICPDLFPKCYRFADWSTSKLFSCHASFSIMACRFLEEANRVLGHDDPFVEKQARRFSKRIWMSYPWLRCQIPLAVDFTASLVFAYESGNADERAFCMASLKEMDSSRHPPPIGEWVEPTIMANAKAYTGRLPFIKTQDAKFEYDGVGCRC